MFFFFDTIDVHIKHTKNIKLILIKIFFYTFNILNAHILRQFLFIYIFN
jgi:hypothetical protein